MSNAEQTRSPASPALTPAPPDQGAVTTDGIAGRGAAAPATPRGHIGLIVVGSLATGLAAALLLVFVGAPDPASVSENRRRQRGTPDRRMASTKEIP